MEAMAQVGDHVTIGIRKRSTHGHTDERPTSADRDRFGTGVDVLPRSGDILYVTRAASVQFVEPLFFRVIRVHDWPTYDGWVWLDGYELNASGEAVDRRSIFVQLSGLRQVGAPEVRARAVPRSATTPAAAGARAH
jgi:hypothetical protein